MALVPPLDLTAEEVKALLAPLRNDLSVAVYNCQNAFAVGAIIRTAHSFLVREIIVIGTAPWYEKASMGMQHFETIVTVADEEAFLRHTAGRPVWAVERDHATQSVYELSGYPENVVLLFGSERAGLPSTLVAKSEAVIGIPMYGINHSFPVAVAAGMVLSDWARRRYTPGTVVVGPPRRGIHHEGSRGP